MQKNNFNQEIIWLLNEKYNCQITPSATKDIARIKKGEPVDYVIGYKNFLGCKIDLRYKTLIPRAETEFWMEKAFFVVRKRQKNQKCLDIFAGSGCCGVSLLKNISNARCDFIDSQRNCLKQINFNLRANKIKKNRYNVFQGDIFRLFSSSDKKQKHPINQKYDYIFANPPYIDWQKKDWAQKSVLLFEPLSALFARQKGLYFIEKFLAQSKSHLQKRGLVFLEFSPEQKNQIKSIALKNQYSKIKFFKDQFGKYRWLILEF